MADRDMQSSDLVTLFTEVQNAVDWIHRQGGHDLGGPEHRIAARAAGAMATIEARLYAAERALRAEQPAPPLEAIARLRDELREVADFEGAEWPGLLSEIEAFVKAARDGGAR